MTSNGLRPWRIGRMWRLAISTAAVLALTTACSSLSASRTDTSGAKRNHVGQPKHPTAASLGNYCTPSIPATVEVDGSLNRMISSQLGPGWIGGDATYSTKLPDGREAFDFSDTLIGTAALSGADVITGLIHNSELVGFAPNMGNDYGGTYNAPQALIPDTSNSDAHWYVAATFVENGSQLIFVNEYTPNTGIRESFTGRSGVAVLHVGPSGMPTYTSVEPIPTDGTTTWGNALIQNGVYTYIYGTDTSEAPGGFLGMKVARVVRGRALDTHAWQYWNGKLWVGDESNASPIPYSQLFTGIAQQPTGIGYVAVSLARGPKVSVDVSYSCTPEGPWSGPTPVYAVPEVSQYHGETAYTPTLHPELSEPGHLVVSYNLDTVDGIQALRANIHVYQPRFLELGY